MAILARKAVLSDGKLMVDLFKCPYICELFELNVAIIF